MSRAVKHGLRMLLVSAIAATSVSVLGSQPAAAAGSPFTGCKYSGSGNNLKWSNATTRYEYSNPGQVAVEAWNSTSTQFNFANVNTDANLVVADGNFGDTEFVGLAEMVCHGGYHQVTVKTWWNRYHTDSYSGQARKYVMVHEIGHALGLADLEGQFTCANMPIMYANTKAYDECGFTEPRPIDVSRVNSLY
ncbi:hypothetical protein AB0D49_25830 [Streptomyces sp. NPDC048290]|uniref:hypothetical protein n=1 Tax=Streptomyces sp. NPDC048290 TaxID=3155811 RepID=UPI00343522EA